MLQDKVCCALLTFDALSVSPSLPLLHHLHQAFLSDPERNKAGEEAELLRGFSGCTDALGQRLGISAGLDTLAGKWLRAMRDIVLWYPAR